MSDELSPGRADASADATARSATDIATDTSVAGRALRLTAMVAACSGLAAAAVVLAAAYVFKPASPSFAIVDLHKIQEYRQLQLATLMLKPGVTEADKVRAKAMAESLGPEIESALRATREKCKCTILVKAAVVLSDGSMPDHTTELMGRLSMTGESVDEMQARLRGYMNTLAARPAGTDLQMQDLMMLLQKGTAGQPGGRQ